MLESYCPSHRAIFEELARLAPDAPFLALGQTAFWDEPMKAGVALCSRAQGFNRRFVAGIHDTDYFAKHAGSKKQGRYVILPHNDTTTRDLWSAAGEFSALFGSETVITRESLLKSGSKVGRIHRERPSALDSATEAWGWRGVVYQGETTPVIAETPFAPLQETLLAALDWAVDATLDLIPGCQSRESKAAAERLRAMACSATEQATDGSLGGYYRALLPQMYDFAAGGPVEVETTATTELLRFNTVTAGRARFQLVDLFLRPETRDQAREAYNTTLSHTEIYTLDRFGSWAIPFDLVVPGHGRGTLRISPKAVIVMTPTPLFITTKVPVRNVADLAAAIERKFGENCTLVGKAVSLIGMLASEFVFVFHEGASGYIHHSTAFHQRLADLAPKLNPILRVKYGTWDALKECKKWITLPEPYRRPFGADDLSTVSFADRWRIVVDEQLHSLEELSQFRRPIDFVRYLAKRFSSSWSQPAARYETMHLELQALHTQLRELKVRKAASMAAWRELKQKRNALEHAKGAHWREHIFEKAHTDADLTVREDFTKRLKDIDLELMRARAAWIAFAEEQEALVTAPEILEAHAQRRDLELELELKRLRLVREAVTVSKGLVKAGYRPSSWWFPLLCEDGGWFRETVSHAEYYLEPLQ